ncbi:MAG: hypothetical protein R2849_14970 [Thermomicrobiales bacterium]
MTTTAVAFIDARRSSRGSSRLRTERIPAAAPAGADDDEVMTELAAASGYDFELWSTAEDPPQEAAVIRSVMGTSAPCCC